MPAKDRYHDTVRRALVKDGWTITDDPFTVLAPERFLYIDLRAEKPSESLVVLIEVKSFEHPSQVEALAAGVGKYNLYQVALSIAQITDPLYLAVPLAAFHGIMSETLGQRLLQEYNVHLLIVDPDREEIVQWIT